MIPRGVVQEPRHHFQAGVAGDDGWMWMLHERDGEKVPSLELELWTSNLTVVIAPLLLDFWGTPELCLELGRLSRLWPQLSLFSLGSSSSALPIFGPGSTSWECQALWLTALRKQG